MAQPILDWSGWGLTCDHDPTSNEPWDNGIIQYGTWWINSNTNEVFWCSNQGNNDNTGLSWLTLKDLIKTEVPTLHNVSSPSFNSPRTPSMTKNTQVNALVSISLTILQTSLITAEVDEGSGYVTVAQFGKGLIALTSPDYSTLSFLVPAGASYRLMSSGTGTTAVSAILEAY